MSLDRGLAPMRPARPTIPGNTIRRLAESMNPTLREGDLLEVEPYKERLTRAGDVIAFPLTNGDTHIVHRVIRVRADGIHTRGDHNASEDPRQLRPAEIAGQVVAAWRGQKRHKVLGGRAGAALGTLARVLVMLDRGISPILPRPYHALARSGAVRQILAPGWRPRFVGYQVDGRIGYQLLLGVRLVGGYDHDLGAWRIKRPFKLLVDERSLPVPGKGPTDGGQMATVLQRQPAGQ